MSRHEHGFGCPHCKKFHQRGHVEKQASAPARPKNKQDNFFSQERWYNALGYEVYFPQGVNPGPDYHTPEAERLVRSRMETRKQQIDSYNEQRKHQLRAYAEKLAAEKAVEQTSEPVIGYRVWNYREGKLYSTAQSQFSWPHREALKRDLFNDAGIHAVKDYKRVIDLLREYCLPRTTFNTTPQYNGVAGAINMWGEVKECETGWLSEFAYPKELYVGEDTDPLRIMELEENYGVPVVMREELNLAALQMPRFEVDWKTLSSVFTRSPNYLIPRMGLGSFIPATVFDLGADAQSDGQNGK